MWHHEAFGQRLRQRAEQMYGYGYQTALSKALHKQNPQIHRYCHGRVPEWPILVDLARVLDVSVDWLLTGKEVHRPIRPSRAELRRELDLFLDGLPEFVIERILWQAKALYEVGKRGNEAFPDYILRTRGE